MIVTITRKSQSVPDDACYGEIAVDGAYVCLSMERISKIIPTGTYDCSIYFSPHNHRQVPLLQVPGREYIEIHPANFAAQLEGCIATGLNQDGAAMDNSVEAFDLLMSKLQSLSESIQFVVSEAF